MIDLGDMHGMIAQCPDHDLGGLFGAVVAPIGSLVVLPVLEVAQLAKGISSNRVQVVRSPSVRQLVKDDPLFPGQAVDRADVDLTACTDGAMQAITAIAAGPVGMAADGDCGEFEAGLGEQLGRSLAGLGDRSRRSLRPHASAELLCAGAIHRTRQQ